MKILIIEDDKQQFELIQEILLKFHELSPLEILRVATEAEFRRRLEEIAIDKPEVIMLDIMLRWSDPDPQMEMPPKDILENGFDRAGIRCGKMLAGDSRTSTIPIIVYSVLEAEDLEDDFMTLTNVRHLVKDFDPRTLLETIRSVAGI